MRWRADRACCVIVHTTFWIKVWAKPLNPNLEPEILYTPGPKTPNTTPVLLLAADAERRVVPTGIDLGVEGFVSWLPVSSAYLKALM